MSEESQRDHRETVVRNPVRNDEGPNQHNGGGNGEMRTNWRTFRRTLWLLIGYGRIKKGGRGQA